MSIKKNLFIGVIALGLSPLALASGSYVPAPVDTWSPGVYAGLQLGYGMTNWDNVFDEDLIDIGDVNDSDAFAGRVFLGYDFHKNFAIEAGYSQFFNNPSVTVMGVEYGMFGNTYAVDLSGKIKAIVVDNFGLFAKLGVAYLHTCDGDFHDSIDNVNLTYGAGLYYDFNKNFTMGASWTRFNGDQTFGDDYQPFADMFTIDAMWKFVS